MTDDTETPSASEADGRTDRFLDRWRDHWLTDEAAEIVPRPTSQYQGIDWTTVQAARGETHVGRI